MSADSAPEIVDEAVAAPLARFHGEQPPAPDWFVRAIEMRPERAFSEVQGARIETLAWGDVGRPGVLLLHGSGAHADWWSFIAPYFAEQYRVCAMSWSGMGRSDWRDRYTMDIFVEEAFTAARDCGLFESAEKPVFIAHSFGASPTLRCASQFGERLKGAVILDAGVRPPSRPWGGPPSRKNPNRVYSTLAAALARFRLAPLQPCENAFILDYIAREGLMPAPLPGHGGDVQGWTWRFDPLIWSKVQGPRPMDTGEDLRQSKCPVAFIWGEQSMLMRADVVEHTKSVAPAGTPFIAVPEARHHLMLDQPLAVVAALRTLLAVWP